MCLMLFEGDIEMRIDRKSRAIITSAALIILCLAIIIGTTAALFSDQETVVNHLRAGDLDITLERIKLTSTYVNNKGFLESYTTTDIKDFTNETSDNVFALEGALIVPQSKYSAEMRVSNNSDVAFAYWVEIIYTGMIGVELADQIKVVIDTAEGKMLSEGLKVGSETNPIAILGVGDFDTFTASIEFLDLASVINNAAQGDSVTFDLVVHAVQYTGEDPNK